MEEPTSSCLPADWSRFFVTCRWSEFLLDGCTEHTMCHLGWPLPPTPQAAGRAHCWVCSIPRKQCSSSGCVFTTSWTFYQNTWVTLGTQCIWHLDVPSGLQGGQGKTHHKTRSPCSDHVHRDWPPHCAGSVLILFPLQNTNRFWNLRSCHETNSLFTSQLSLRVTASPCWSLLKSEITQKKHLSLHGFVWRNVTCDHLRNKLNS